MLKLLALSLSLSINNGQATPQSSQVITDQTSSFSVSLAMAAYAILLLFFFFSILLPNGLASSFTIDLIHYDSPKSPFFNSSETFYDRVLRDIRQSDSRIIEYLLSSSATLGDISSIVQTRPSGAGYLMSISLGTPPVQFWAILDTGGHLTWNTACDSTIGSYDPSRSSTYKPVPYDSRMCQQVTPCTESSRISDGTCIYSCRYTDGAATGSYQPIR